MTSKTRVCCNWLSLAAVLLLSIAPLAISQGQRVRGDRILNEAGGGAVAVDPANLDARKYQEQAGDGVTPMWTNNPSFPRDMFTFVRVKYTVNGDHGWGSSGVNRWIIDWPDSELNLSYRLQQMSSMRTHTNGVILELTDKRIKDYPFIYFVEPGRLTFVEAEVKALRDYCNNGGFAMFDDFWGDREWKNFHQEIKKVFPDKEPVELPLTHPIFHGVFDLKEKPQVPGVNWGIQSEQSGITYEARHNPGAETVHYRAVFDDKGRIMVLICHNTDLGDGWEREGQSEYYFREFSEKKAYPLGINIIFYAMTH